MNFLKELLNQGFLIKEDAVEIIKELNEEKIKKLLEELKKTQTFILSKDIIKKILSSEVEILKEFEPRKSFSIQEYVKQLNERYNFLQNILLKKLELTNVISINKRSKGKISVIGFVKEKKEKDNEFLITLEDPTGDIDILVKEEDWKKLELDDVIAVSGFYSEKLIANKIFYPDIPLRTASHTKDKILVAFLKDEKECEAHYKVFFDKVFDNLKNKKIKVKTPAFLKIENIIILIAPDLDGSELLKKRFVNLKKTDFLIDPIPDILFTNKGEIKNYKGVTIVLPNNIINLKTRDITPI